MPELTQITDFTRLFTIDTPLIDTRAPIEFEQGALMKFRFGTLRDHNQ
jgi:tRNA 2-selenouridine synthase SelU